MPSAAERAAGRLDQALRKLEAAVERRLAAGGDVDGLVEEVQTLGADRARLADSLDRARAQTARLEQVNREVSRRLVAAMETIRHVLQSDGERR